MYTPPAYVYLALLMVLPLSAAAFAAWPPLRAALTVILGGILFLPEVVAFDPPLLPAMDKNGIPLACALLGLLMVDPKRVFAAKPLRGVDLWFIFFVIGAIGTARTNMDGFAFGGALHWNGVDHYPITVLPALATYDALSMLIADIISYWLPFFVGRVLVQTREDLRQVVRTIAFCGVIYVPLMVLEAIVSPQLHRWIYSFHAADFAHSMRGTGFKPTVFLKGGLAVAMFMYVALMCAAACVRARIKLPLGLPAMGAVVAIVGALAISRNVGVLVYMFATLPAALAFGPGMQLRMALVLGLSFLSFPFARATDVFPADQILQVARSVSIERAQSLEVRFTNESMLLEKWTERPRWGWGGYGRNRIYNVETGRDESVTDGEWVSVLGARGYVGVITWFAMLFWPVVMAWRGVKKVAGRHDKLLLGLLTLCLAIHAVDMLPNSSFNATVFIVAGVVVGATRALRLAAAPLEPAYVGVVSAHHDGPAAAYGALAHPAMPWQYGTDLSPGNGQPPYPPQPPPGPPYG